MEDKSGSNSQEQNRSTPSTWQTLRQAERKIVDRLVPEELAKPPEGEAEENTQIPTPSLKERLRGAWRAVLAAERLFVNKHIPEDLAKDPSEEKDKDLNKSRDRS